MGYEFNFCGQVVTKQQIVEIKEIVSMFKSLSRNEIANTVCELFSWKRPTGKLKTIECKQFIESLEKRGILKLPKLENFNTKGKKRIIEWTAESDPDKEISCPLSELKPISLDIVKDSKERKLWREYIDRYHYLKYKIPVGAHLMYFIKSNNNINLGCFLFTSPAWKMTPRDEWIGWNTEQRKRNLQKVVNNARFLIFPWVKVKNFASFALSITPKKVPEDWEKIYGYKVFLLESLVDPEKFKGVCYKAANWIHVGTTTGYGKNIDRLKRKEMTPKEIFLYSLSSNVKEELKK